LRLAQLLILHLQLGLMDLELMDQSLEIARRWGRGAVAVSMQELFGPRAGWDARLALAGWSLHGRRRKSAPGSGCTNEAGGLPDAAESACWFMGSYHRITFLTLLFSS
jgi:hypothetical protein